MIVDTSAIVAGEEDGGRLAKALAGTADARMPAGGDTLLFKSRDFTRTDIPSAP